MRINWLKTGLAAAAVATFMAGAIVPSMADQLNWGGNGGYISIGWGHDRRDRDRRDRDHWDRDRDRRDRDRRDRWDRDRDRRDRDDWGRRRDGGGWGR